MLIVLIAEDVDNLHFFEKMVKQTLCLMNCKNSTMPELSAQLPKEVMDDFERKMPYDYLQLCYYNVSYLTVKLEQWFPTFLCLGTLNRRRKTHVLLSKMIEVILWHFHQ